MTPAVNAAKRAKLAYTLHEYAHNPDSASYGEEAAALLGQDPIRVFKTLLVAIEGDQKKLAVAIVPVIGQLNLKAMASALNVKKVIMAEAHAAERSTGYIVGGISPLGQKKKLPTVIDVTAKEFSTIFFSAGRRGLELEMSAGDLATLTLACFVEIGR
ncbi:Cys-tRNA(Pro) deacylase [Neptunomonas antarctica]|uniref:Cys-tRNA(Pro)/Cys-tRNA(Cys) deacylase n=1 Tax=Neptunomonas antarctica TaxID=619304 RepID=A0A1N7M763_9GAMM|nr:Cys-tRNA(Pro) deacylase [Neptunomonas antarctica]SIS81892.1 Cys-tRNA(Pro) hydrolase [Neptunomonas antarctica]